MPNYEYQCTQDGSKFELWQEVGSSPPPCPTCGAVTKKVFHPTRTIFKGSGFYVTDLRAEKAAGKSRNAEAGGEAEAAPAETAPAAAPAPATPAAPSAPAPAGPATPGTGTASSGSGSSNNSASKPTSS